jgi:hypothetical protein
MKKMNKITYEKFTHLDWKKIERNVSKAQNLIGVAWKSGDKWRAKILMERLVYSFDCRALAVRRVTTNQGSRNWVFSALDSGKKKENTVSLYDIGNVAIKRHT